MSKAGSAMPTLEKNSELQPARSQPDGFVDTAAQRKARMLPGRSRWGQIAEFRNGLAARALGLLPGWLGARPAGAFGILMYHRIVVPPQGRFRSNVERHARAISLPVGWPITPWLSTLAASQGASLRTSPARQFRRRRLSSHSTMATKTSTGRAPNLEGPTSPRHDFSGHCLPR